MKTIAVMTTTDSLEHARSMAHGLVERKLAACVQISNIESHYVWDGETQHEDEFRLMIKTTDERYADVEAAICELHGYDLPAIYALVLDPVYEPYAQWVAANSIGAKVG